MSNFRKFISMSAVAVLAGTNLLAPLSYADAATAWASLVDNDFKRNPLEFQMPDHNVSLYAVTEPNNYYVEFHGNTGTGTMEKQTFTYDDPQNLNPNAFTKTWYTYSGWNTDANGGGSGYADKQEVENLAETGTVDLYAQWNVNSYDITYDLNDRTGSSSWSISPQPTGHVNYGVSFDVSEPTRLWYDFSGWNISNMDAETNKIDDANTHESSINNSKWHTFESLRATSGTVSFVAQWSAALSSYKVKHCRETLTDDDYTICVTENLSGYTDQPVTPANTGYDWFTAPGTQTKSVTADGNTEFTYNYDRNSYTLTLIAGTWVQTAKGTGTVNTDGVTTTENDSNTGSFKFEEPIEFSYVLKSWYQNATWSGYSGTASSFIMPVGGAVKEIFAETITYTVTGNYHWGTGAAPDANSYVHTYTVETSLTLPNSLTRDNSIFSWWIGKGITTPTKNVTVGPNEIWDKVYEAVWDCEPWYRLGTDQCVANENTEYEVRHYQEQLNGSYELKYTETPTGKTDTRAVWTGIDYTWFSGWYLSGAEQTINWDVEHNKTIVYVRYDRESYNYTITAPAWGVAAAITSSSASWANSEGSKIKYEDTVTLNADMAPGYEFDYWEVKDAENNPVTVTNSGQIEGATFPMPALSVTITPHLKQTSFEITYVLNSWSVAGTNPTSYTVESGDITLIDPTRDHSVFLWWSGGDHTGMFSWDEVAIEEGSTWDKTFTANWWCKAWYHAEGNSCVANTYVVELDDIDGEGATGSVTFTYDQPNTIPTPQQSWYKFVWWDIEWLSSWAKVGDDNLPTPNATGVTGTSFTNLTTVPGSGTVTFTAKWEAVEVEYVVHHYLKEEWKTTYELTWTVTWNALSDHEVLFNTLTWTYVWFTYSGWYVNEGTTTRPSGSWTGAAVIDKHGTTVINLYYDRNKHTVTLSGDVHVDSLSWEGAREFEYGADVTVQATAKTWYHFKQWDPTPDPRS